MEVWANSAGSWFTASIWYFWDEQTQTAQPYGRIPQVGDYVYLNGYTIQFATNPINIGNGTITNKKNPRTNRQGGFLQATTGPWSITANLEVYNSYISADTAGVMKYVIGNIYIDSTVTTSAFYKTGGGVSTLNVVGNIDAYAPLYHDTATTYSLSITGELHYHNISSFPKNPTTATIVGRLIMDYCVFDCTTLNLNGSVEYKSNRNDVGIRYTTLNILNPDTFTWRDMTEPRSNPFIILTDAEMNNRQQYPPEDEVKQGTEYVWGQKVGTYTPDYPQEAEVLQGVTYDNGNKTGTLTPVILGDYPAEADVKVGVVFDYGNKVGTFQPVADYPAEADVLQGVEYAYGQMTGTLSVATDYPQEANVLLGVEYANGSMVGTLEVVQMQADYPSEDDVRFDIVFDFGNKQGKCHVPIPEDVREGVPVDVNDVGTLIPSSGGDRLRIADFGYYTNAQSDTYIVDLTEQDKPKFAVAEERVLIEMFPDLDLDNIPDKYFDDLFVKYLKYRLIVEYYRTAGINSTFTPSEPTTEIVNYQNVRNEVWLNSANIYLKAWGKKYPDSIVKPQRILL